MKDLCIIVVNLIFFILWKNKKYIEGITTKIVEWKMEIGNFLFLILNIIYGIVIYEYVYFLDLIGTNLSDSLKIELNSADQFSSEAIMGLITILGAIFIYLIFEKQQFKKYLYEAIVDIKEMLYISIVMLFFIWFKINYYFMIYGFIYMAWLLYKNFDIRLKLSKPLIPSSQKEEYIKKLRVKKSGNGELGAQFFYEIRKTIEEDINQRKTIDLDEDLDYYLIFLENNSDVILKDYKAIDFNKQMYSKAIEFKDDLIFNKIYYLHIILARMAYNNDKKGMFYESLLLEEFIYKYYLNAKDKKKSARKVKNRLEYEFDISNDFKNDFDLGKEWLAIFYRVINKLVEESYINNDEAFFNYFLKLIKYKVEYCDENRYILLECANYFGLILLLNKIKEEDKDKGKIKDKFLITLKENLNQELLCKTDWKTIFDLYIFIKKQNIKNLLEWDRYFEPEQDLVELRFYDVITNNEINKLFLIFLYEESDINYIINKIKDYKKNNRYTYEDNCSLMESLKEMESKYRERLENIFKKIDKEFEIKEKQQIAKEKISIEKIEKIKGTISGVLKENWILNKFFKDKIKEQDKEQDKEGRSMGVFLPKKMVLKDSKYGNVDNYFRGYVKNLNRDIGNILIKSLKEKTKAENPKKMSTVLEVAEETKKDKILIISGINVETFFKKNIKSIERKYDFSENKLNKYGNNVIGLLKEKIPIYYFVGGEKGMFLIEDGIFKKIIQYKSNEEKVSSDYKYEDNVAFARMKVRTYEEFSKDEGFKSKKYDEDKLREMKTRVEFCLMYHFEVELDETKKVIEIKIDEEEQEE